MKTRFETPKVIFTIILKNFFRNTRKKRECFPDKNLTSKMSYLQAEDEDQVEEAEEEDFEDEDDEDEDEEEDEDLEEADDPDEVEIIGKSIKIIF